MRNQPHLLNGLGLAANDALKAFDGELVLVLFSWRCDAGVFGSSMFREE
jgi:hypothetical protein